MRKDRTSTRIRSVDLLMCHALTQGLKSCFYLIDPYLVANIPVCLHNAFLFLCVYVFSAPPGVVAEERSGTPDSIASSSSAPPQQPTPHYAVQPGAPAAMDGETGAHASTQRRHPHKHVLSAQIHA